MGVFPAQIAFRRSLFLPQIQENRNMMKQILLVLLVCVGLQVQAQNTYSVEGKWIPEGFSNTLYILEDGVKYTYYCISSNCDSLYNTFEAGDENALPGTNSYWFANDTLTIDYNFGNIAAQYVEFECDGNILNFVESQSSNRWIRLNTNLDDCIAAGITELSSKESDDDRIFDLMGRELVEVPLGTMYIKNRKLYVSN
jgi:hypothetical protein